MIEDLRRLRLEIDSLRSAIKRERHLTITDQETLDRVQQLFWAWSTNVRPRLDQAGVPPEVLKRVDVTCDDILRLTSHRSSKKRYLALLRRLRLSLVHQILPEVAAISSVGQPSSRTSGTERLIPEILDVPNELIPRALHGWIHQMRDFLRRNAFERNVFVMISYRERLARLLDAVKAVLMNLELNAIVARDHAITDDLYNPVACLLCCNYGIAFFDQAEPRQTHNPNVTH